MNQFWCSNWTCICNLVDVFFFHVNAHRYASFGFHFDSVRANNFHNKTFNWRRWVYVCVCEWFKPVGCNTRWTRVCFSLLPSQSWIGTDMLNKLNGPLWLHWCNTDKVIVNGFLEKTVKKNHQLMMWMFAVIFTCFFPCSTAPPFLVYFMLLFFFAMEAIQSLKYCGCDSCSPKIDRHILHSLEQQECIMISWSV